MYRDTNVFSYRHPAIISEMRLRMKSGMSVSVSVLGNIIAEIFGIRVLPIPMLNKFSDHSDTF